ncbi:MAG: hypothetical protein ACYDDF_10775 [Thermoplasmatota archaeon]
MPVEPASRGMDAARRLDQALHDLTNAVAAARAYAEVINRRAIASKSGDESITGPLVAELERTAAIARLIRYRTFDDYAAGDVLSCLRCDATFVHRRATGKSAQCRRCKSFDVTRWKPQD